MALKANIVWLLATEVVEYRDIAAEGDRAVFQWNLPRDLSPALKSVGDARELSVWANWREEREIA